MHLLGTNSELRHTLLCELYQWMHMDNLHSFVKCCNIRLNRFKCKGKKITILIRFPQNFWHQFPKLTKFSQCNIWLHLFQLGKVHTCSDVIKWLLIYEIFQSINLNTYIYTYTHTYRPQHLVEEKGDQLWCVKQFTISRPPNLVQKKQWTMNAGVWSGW